MIVKYKRIKVAMPHCGECGERLQGNGSYAQPYKCTCGSWEANWNNPQEMVLKK